MRESLHIVSTDRCLLRHATSSDYEALATAISASEFPSELPLAGLYRQGRLKGWLDSVIEMSVSGNACLLSVDLRTGEKCVGQVSLVQKGDSGSWNLAFWIHPSHWGKGLALETARAVVQHAFTVKGVEEVWAGAALWNQRSIKTLLNLGLEPIQDTELSESKAESENAFRAFSLLRDHWMHGQCSSRSDL
jgi:RimJ/RimL family protein N-acetyltransferase